MTAALPDPNTGHVESLAVRDLRSDDLDEVVRIDALHTGREKRDYWSATLRRFVDRTNRKQVGLAVEETEGRLAGYLLGEVRAFEFGSEACGWVFAVGVEPDRLRGHVASRLLREACRRFRTAGIETVRTMVRRNDVPVLSFFRTAGFEGGTFVQLERNLEEGA